MFYPLPVNSAERLPIELKKQLLLKQFDKAVPALQKLASQGDNEARYQLALCYLNGDGITSSVYPAVELLRAAANKGHSKASYLLGTMYYQGDRIEKDISAAKSYLFIAAQKGHRLAKKLSQQIDNKDHGIPLSTKETQQRLEYAARTGDTLRAEDSLSSGANINKKNIHGNTPLIIASRNKQYAFIKWLLTKKPKLSITDNNQDTALHFVSLAGEKSLAKKLIALGAPLDPQNNNGRTPLINAVISGSPDLLQLLLISGADSQLKDKQHKSAFDYAENKNDAELLTILAPFRTNTNDYEKLQRRLKQLTQQTRQKENLYFGWPLLAVAVAQNEAKLVSLLINKRADPWEQSTTGVSAISLVAIKDENNYSGQLLNKTSSKLVPDTKQSLTLLVVAAKKNNPLFIQKLSQKLSPKIIAEIEFLKTPLWHAIDNSSEVAALKLINWQQTDFRADKKGRNLLHLATRKNLPKVVTALLNKGFNINRTDQSERSPFWHATDKGHIKVMNLLVSKRANIRIPDNEGNTPLHRAVLSGHLQAVTVLLGLGAEVNKKNKNGNTAIFFAVASRPDILKSLIKHDAGVTVRNHLTYTPLMIAVNNKCLQCIQLLISADANPSRRNSKGLDSYDLAKGDKQIIAILDQ